MFVGKTREHDGVEKMGDMTRGAVLSADAVQRVLDENQQIILAVIENQNKQQGHDCAKWLQKLHRNLMMLATLGDGQLNSAPGGCTPPTRPRRASGCSCRAWGPSAYFV